MEADRNLIDSRPEAAALLSGLKRDLPALERLLADCRGHWGEEDAVYRFYHQSFKVYSLQELTSSIVQALRAVAPERGLNAWFRQIVAEGTGKTFAYDHNQAWLATTRPILEAYFHAKYFLEMCVRYGKELDAPPSMLPSGWASVLYLYGLR